MIQTMLMRLQDVIISKSEYTMVVATDHNPSTIFNDTDLRIAWSGRSTHSRNGIRCCEIGQEIMYNHDSIAWIS